MDYNKCRKAIGWTALRKVYQQGLLDVFEIWIEPLTS